MHCGGADVGVVVALVALVAGGGGGPQAAARRHSPQPGLPLATRTSPPHRILLFRKFLTVFDAFIVPFRFV